MSSGIQTVSAAKTRIWKGSSPTRKSSWGRSTSQGRGGKEAADRGEWGRLRHPDENGLEGFASWRRLLRLELSFEQATDELDEERLQAEKKGEADNDEDMAENEDFEHDGGHPTDAGEKPDRNVEESSPNDDQF